MSKLPFVLLLLHNLLLLVPSHADEFSVAAYYAGAGYQPDYNVNASAHLLTDLILASQEPREDATLNGCCLKPLDYATARQARTYKEETTGKSMRIWLSVGGWGGSKQFEEIVYDTELKKELIRNLMRICKTESLDGVDFNWEQPLNDGDFNMYYGLIRLTYQVFKKAGLLVSVALHKGMYMPSKMYQFVDRINLMTYDMDMTSGIYHADYDKVTTEVKAFISRNAPPEKLLMGIPMYARGKTKFAVSKTMGELVEEANNNSSIVVLESSMGDYQWDNPQKIDEKVAFAVEKGLSGVFFWELGQDLLNDKYGSGGILLTATDESAKKYIRAKKEKEEKSINDEL